MTITHPHVCVERLIEFSIDAIYFRIWFDCTNQEIDIAEVDRVRVEYFDQYATNGMEPIGKSVWAVSDADHINALLGKLKHVNAIQVKRNQLPMAVSTIVYTTPFDDGVHG